MYCSRSEKIWGNLVPASEYLGPRPAALVESLRAFPYSTPSAIADLIDNSIVANAKDIRIYTAWNEGNPYVEIVDDGNGMTESQLVEALRFAGVGPSAERSSKDLGRFGLGLKTASLSQCSRMTVTSLSNGSISNMGWDVDELRESGDWKFCSSSVEIIKKHRQLLNNQNGTVVRWQKLDRLLGSDIENQSIRDLDEIFEKVQDHLEMVFHRFLSRTAATGEPELIISINDYKVIPWDPFLDSYPKPNEVWKVEEIDIPMPNGVSRIIGYVLPTERQATADGALEMWEKAGRKRWNKLQGFYVYRLDRLLTIGGYLDLDRLPDEHSKLARICIELDNKTDNDWLLDVTKSSVTPPVRSRAVLNRVARTVGARATARFRSKVFRFCSDCLQRPCTCPGKKEFELVWLCPDLYQLDGKFSINGDHSIIRGFSESLEKDDQFNFSNILKLISKTIPLSLLRAVPQEDAGRRGLNFRNDNESERLIRSITELLVGERLGKGQNVEEIRELLSWTEPFSDYSDIVDEVITKYSVKSK
jgi:hypothetical protein